MTLNRIAEETYKPISTERISNLEGISNLERGYWYEIQIISLLDNHNISYTSNPIEWEEWKKKQWMNTYDIEIETVNGKVKVDCKYCNTHIYPNWFMDDWYSRECEIFVCSNKFNVGDKQHKLLKRQGRKLMNTFEFIGYIKRIATQHTHNQYVVLGNKKQYQYTVLEDRNEYKPTVKLYQYHTNICNYSMLCILLQGNIHVLLKLSTSY